MTAKIAKKKDERVRNWAFVAYPDSCPQDWREIMTALGLCWARSPLHDKDVNETAEGGTETKKAHWHFVLKFANKVSFEQVKQITDKLNATIPQKVANVVGAVRYMAHLDNPEKAQYKVADILEGGGFDVDNILKLTPAQEREILTEILRYCRANGIDELCDLEDICLDEKEEWLPVYYARQLTIFRSLRSRQFKNQKLRETV